MKINIKDLILTALFASLAAVGGFINIRVLTVPLTLQLFFCSFAGIILGARLGALSQALYLILGLMGLPIFANGGGPNYIFNPTFGYIIGFVLAAYVIGRVFERFNRPNILNISISILIGLVCDYLVGILYFYFIYNNYLGKAMTIYNSLVIMLPYILKDIILSFLVAFIINRMLPVINK